MEYLRVISQQLCSGPLKNYSYVLAFPGSKKTVIVDPAWEMEEYTNILQLYHLTPAHILLTHASDDHVNLVNAFNNQYEVAVWMPCQQKTTPPFSATDLRLLLLGDLKCTAFLTPGHTTKSSYFLIDSHLFTGDTLFIEGCGICCDLEGNPEELHQSLIFLKTRLSPQVKIYPGHRYQAYPGQTFEYVLKNNLYLHLEDKREFIKYRMRENQTELFNFK